MEGNAYPEKPWEHPDWYDLHDREWTAGSEREPEHYHELLIAMPPLDKDDHVLDIGAGTGKLSMILAKGFPMLGMLTLVEPNLDKLTRARNKIKELLSAERVKAVEAALGKGVALPLARPATMAVVGSVLMPPLEEWPGTPESAIDWIRAVLSEIRNSLAPGGWFYALETLARFWVGGGRSNNRRLTLLELQSELERAGFESVECVYRFRDRVIVRGQRS